MGREAAVNAQVSGLWACLHPGPWSVDRLYTCEQASGLRITLVMLLTIWS
jgi:hypothetical protein